MGSGAMDCPEEQRSYFVDEAGDPILFARRGRVIVGTPGNSRFFMLGLLEVQAPQALQQGLDDLRHTLLADPYFDGVPSMQAAARKTAEAFHAKDDLPEVRFLVFRFLRQLSGLRFFAIVADKCAILQYVRSRNRTEDNYRYHPNELYDYLVRRLFRDRFPNPAHYHIVFARRGRRDRTRALKQAIESARQRYTQRWGHEPPPACITIRAAYPHEEAGLQAVDYFLWALQRLYERGEERFVRVLWPHFRVVFDIHDQDWSENGWGRIYRQTFPLTANAIQGRHEKNKSPECP